MEFVIKKYIYIFCVIPHFSMKFYYKYKDAAKTISRFISLIASLNLFSKSVFPMFFAAWHNCLSTSSKRRIDLIIDPRIYSKSIDQKLLQDHHLLKQN